jgi:hypothetical protein
VRTKSFGRWWIVDLLGRHDTVSTGAAVSETNALLTFYNDTTTQRVINNGAMRVIDRTGTATIYFNAGAAATSIVPYVPRRQTGADVYATTRGCH